MAKSIGLETFEICTGSKGHHGGQWRSTGFAGQAILDMLHTAADKAETDSRQALGTAQMLSSQLRAVQDRIAELEAELQLNCDRANRAEEWLSKISTEIEDRLIKQPEEKRREVSRR